jgi:glycerophosphoryl diester phosphodiesterase family protein
MSADQPKAALIGPRFAANRELEMTNSDEPGSQPAPGQPADATPPAEPPPPVTLPQLTVPEQPTPGYTQPFGAPAQPPGPPPPGYGQPPPPGYGGYGQPPPPGYGGYGQPPPPGYGGYGQPPPPGYGGYGPPGYGPPGYGPPGYGPPGYGPPGYGPGGWPQVPAPGGVPLRPLSLGDIFSGAVNAARRNPAAVFGLTAILMTISAVITSVAEAAFRTSANSTLTTGPGGQISSTQLGNFFAGLVPVLLLTVVLAFVVENVLSGLLTAVIGRGVLGRKVRIGEAWALGRIGSVLAAAFLLVVIGLVIAAPVFLVSVVLALAGVPVGGVVAVAVLGGIATVVVEIMVQVRLCITIPAVVLERIGPLSAVRRSWQLTRGSFWRLFGINLLTGLIASIAAGVLEIPFSIGAGVAGSSRGTIVALIIGAIGSIVSATVVRPFSAGVTVLLYLDMRMRREGLDLALRNAAQGQQLTGEEFATIWQPPAPGQWQPQGAAGWQASQAWASQQQPPGQWPGQGPPASW